MNEILFRLTVLVHFIYLAGNVCAFFYLPLVVDWYIFIPLQSFIVNLAFSTVWDCQLTKLENLLRKKTGRPTINKFVKHYIIKNYLRIRNKL